MELVYELYKDAKTKFTEGSLNFRGLLICKEDFNPFTPVPMKFFELTELILNTPNFIAVRGENVFVTSFEESYEVVTS